MSDQDVWVLRGEVLGLDRSVGPEDGEVRGLYTELDGSKIDFRPPEGPDHLGLKNDAQPVAPSHNVSRTLQSFALDLPRQAVCLYSPILAKEGERYAMHSV